MKPPDYVIPANWSFSLLANYTKSAIRNTRRQGIYSLINILGLSVGMACAILILTHVKYELTFDRHHPHADRIHKVVRETQLQDGRLEYIETSGPLAETIVATIPEVEAASRLYGHHLGFKSGDRRLNSFYSLVDPSFFTIFDYPLVGGGDALAALQQPNTILITQKNVVRYFGDEDPIGKSITVWNENYAKGDYIVSGVLKDYPANTSVYDADFLTTHPPAHVAERLWSNWRPLKRSWRRIETYLLLRDGADPAVVERKLQPIAQEHIGSRVDWPTAYRMLALPGLRFDSRNGKSINILTVYLYAAAAGLILLIAVVNFINLATARSTTRAREVGVRKAAGARSGQLMRQFLVEAMLLSFVSAILAAAIAHQTMPWVAGVLGQPLTLDRDFIPWVLAMSIAVGIASGSYPALALSRFSVTGALESSLGASATRLRKALVVIQFGVTAMLVVTTLTVTRQMNFVATRDQGYDKSGLLRLWIFQREPSLKKDPDRVKQAFTAHGNVLSATLAPGFGSRKDAVVIKKDTNTSIAVNQIEAEASFLHTYRVALVSGRNFRDDSDEILVNETAARALGWDSSIGKEIEIRDDRSVHGVIVGVLKDFHYLGMHERIEPLVIRNRTRPRNHLVLRIRASNISETMAHVRKTWKELAPDYPYQGAFIDEILEWGYRSERRTAAITKGSSVVAITISCIGLIGLAAYAAQSRRKEIGIRKVLGASSRSLVALLSSEFLRLVLIATVVSCPIAYIVSRQWLESFAYRIELSPWLFIGTVASGLLLAFGSVLWQTLRAASVDPAIVLRQD